MTITVRIRPNPEVVSLPRGRQALIDRSFRQEADGGWTRTVTTPRHAHILTEWARLQGHDATTHPEGVWP